MKHISLFIIYYIAVISVNAQIGINTDNPQTLFHADARYTAATSNPSTGAPTTIQQQDDVVITSDGRIGIGTIAPQTKLEINTQGVPGVYPLQIRDVTDPTNKVLVSDNDGNASWEVAPSPIGTVFPIQNLASATLGAVGTTSFAPNSSFTVPKDGYYSFEVRWWCYYSANYPSVSRVSLVLKLVVNGTNVVDSFQYQSPFEKYSITCYVPLYTHAKKNDVLSLHVESIEAPGNIMLNQALQWTTSKVLIKELQVKF